MADILHELKVNKHLTSAWFHSCSTVWPGEIKKKFMCTWGWSRTRPLRLPLGSRESDMKKRAKKSRA
jgi:hypothetical protein